MSHDGVKSSSNVSDAITLGQTPLDETSQPLNECRDGTPSHTSFIYFHIILVFDFPYLIIFTVVLLL